MITPSPTAPLGSVRSFGRYSPGDFPAHSAILCRNSSPLISMAFGLLRRRVACHILGRDLAVGLEKLLDKVASPCGGKEPTLQRLQHHTQQEANRLIKKGKMQEAANIEDRATCLSMFIRQCDSLPAVRRTIQDMFKAGPGVTLSTVHKAKGLEWDTVFLLDANALMPSRWAKAPWEKRQERNLRYVATTRARENLFFINSGDWK